MEWNVMEWNGMKWNGMECNGMECNVCMCVSTSLYQLRTWQIIQVIRAWFSFKSAMMTWGYPISRRTQIDIQWLHPRIFFGILYPGWAINIENSSLKESYWCEHLYIYIYICCTRLNIFSGYNSMSIYIVIKINTNPKIDRNIEKMRWISSNYHPGSTCSHLFGVYHKSHKYP